MKPHGDNLSLTVAPPLSDLERLFNEQLQQPIRKLFIEMPLVQRFVIGFEEDFYLWMAVGWRYRHVHLYQLSQLRPYQLAGRLFYHFALSQVKNTSHERREQHLIAYYFCIRALADYNLMSLFLEKNREQDTSQPLIHGLNYSLIEVDN